jgi:diguanylate cyclase (GGDEF)-like protein
MQMSDPLIPSSPAPPGTEEQRLGQESRQPEKPDWWVWGHGIFLAGLLLFIVIPFALRSLLERADARFGISTTEVVLFLLALAVLFDLYALYQQFLIKRLRRQLAEKQGHSDLLRSLAMIDPLTGLYNRRFAEHRLAEEVARSERKGHPLTVLALDLNNFKEINDKYGHRAGDRVLQEFAAQLNKVIRGSDLAVRLGGDEFIVLLPECTVEQLQLVVGRLGVLEVDWDGKRIPVTFSAGWAQYELGERPEELLACADKILYARKRASKKVQAPSPEEVAPREYLQVEGKPVPLQVLVDLTCPHCQKKNSFAVVQAGGPNQALREEVLCAHCKKAWDPVVPGPIMAGPFPK